jgi:hypothetical protein
MLIVEFGHTRIDSADETTVTLNDVTHESLHAKKDHPALCVFKRAILGLDKPLPIHKRQRAPD